MFIDSLSDVCIYGYWWHVGDTHSLYAFVKFYSSHAAARALRMTVGRLYLGGQHLKV